MPTITNAKYRAIFDDLRGEIVDGKLRVGDALPTQTQLMERYGAALGTVRQALQQLHTTGLVWAKRGKGTFVADQNANVSVPTAAQATAGLVVISSKATEPLVFDRIEILHDAFKAHDIELAIRVVHRDEIEQTIAWARSKSGLIIWGSATFELLDRLGASGTPVVLIGESIDGRVPETVNHITWSLEEIMRTAGELIFGMGHRKVCLVRGRGSAYYDALGRLFMRAADEAGVRDTCDEIFLKTPDDEKLVVDRLNDPNGPPSALLIDGDIKTCRIIHRIQEHGWNVPERVSVVAIGSAHEQRITVAGLTRVEMPVQLGMKRAVDVLAAMFNSPRVTRTEISPRLHLGRTCRPIQSLTQL